MIRNEIEHLCKDIFGQEVPLMTPKHEQFGDFSVNVMQLDPRPDADQIKKFVEAFNAHELIQSAKQEGAYINLFVSYARLHKELESVLQKANEYGSSDWGKGQTWELEHTSPNPNKAMHLGHLRNNVFSMALGNMWEFVGIKVIREAMDNNRGIAIARLMWGFLKYAHPSSTDHDLDYWYNHQDEWDSPESRNMDPGKFVDQLYVKASEDFKNNKDVEKAIRQIVVDWENEEVKTLELWKTVLDYSYAGQKNILDRLGNHYDTIWHEHEHYKDGKDYVKKGLSKGIFVETDEGTIITQLEKDYNLPDTVVQKSDGTSLYITQDIALTEIKMKKTKADKLFWVVGPEQSLAFKQLFAICDQFGIAQLDQLTHLAYGWMSIKGKGSMSSRKGNVIYIDDILDEAGSKAKKLIKDPENLKEDISEVSEKIGVGAVKYSLLRVGRMQGIDFDLDESLSFDGNSGPYIQYAYARMQSILSKAKYSTDTVEVVKLTEDLPGMNDAELNLLRTLPRFQDVVLDSAKNYSPHTICTYLFDLTQKFNVFYEESPVLEAHDHEKAFRLSLTHATSQIVKNGLALLGIDVLDRM